MASADWPVAQRVAWATPELDPTLQGRPVNAKALEVFEQTELVDRSRAIADLGIFWAVLNEPPPGSYRYVRQK